MLARGVAVGKGGPKGSGEPELSLDRRLAREEGYPKQRKQQEQR